MCPFLSIWPPGHSPLEGISKRAPPIRWLAPSPAPPRLQEVNSMINKRLKDALFTDQWSELFMDALGPFNFVLVRTPTPSWEAGCFRFPAPISKGSSGTLWLGL